MRYEFKMPPQDPKSLSAYLSRELLALSQAIAGPSERLNLTPLTVAPTKPRNGDLVYADGVNWKPDGVSGGFFGFTGGIWKKLD